MICITNVTTNGLGTLRTLRATSAATFIFLAIG